MVCQLYPSVIKCKYERAVVYVFENTLIICKKKKFKEQIVPVEVSLGLQNRDLWESFNRIFQKNFFSK